MTHRPRPSQYHALDIYTESLKKQGLSAESALDDLGGKYADGQPRHQQKSSVERIYHVSVKEVERKRVRREARAVGRQRRRKYSFLPDKNGVIHKREIKTGRFARMTDRERRDIVRTSK